jgi:BirA family biotin operon repressor/biotin-[acetyl-CoA-carboxylase] ligase
VLTLDPVAVAAGVRLIAHASLASTNTEALALARAGERGPLWVVAQRQIAGRGRRGRKWVSEPGNLYATLLMSEAGAPADTAQLSFVAALAVHDAIIALSRSADARLSLKWPNDVLCGGRKICGILLEGEGSAAVVIGIGINCMHHPRDAEFPATDLAAAGITLAPEAVFRALSGAMQRRVAQWDRGGGFAAIRHDWLSHADGLGQTIRVRLDDRELTGVFEAIDPRGYLIVRRQDGTAEVIAAGDVFPLDTMRTEHA